VGVYKEEVQEEVKGVIGNHAINVKRKKKEILKDASTEQT